jgi:hypothetical protein
MKTNSIFYSVLVLILTISFSINLSSQTVTWTGDCSSNWQNPSNWDLQIVPNHENDVFIPASYTRKLLIDNINSAKNITIDAGGEIEILLGGSLTVMNNFDVYGTLKMTNGGVTIFGAGHLYLGGTLYIVKGTLTGNTCLLDSLSTTIYNDYNPHIYGWKHGNLEIKGSGMAIIDGTNENPTICDHLILDIPVQIDAGRAFKVRGDLTNNIAEGAIFHIKSDAVKTGSLIHNFAATGVVEAPSYSAKSQQWHYLSSSVENATISVFNGDYTVQWNASATWTGVGDYTPWQNVAGGYLQVAKGYGVYTNLQGIAFEGDLNYSDYTISSITTAKRVLPNIKAGI